MVRILGVGIGFTCAGPALAQPVVYVDAGAIGANDGMSWADAFTDLQPALDAAEASGGLIREIWVANGTYKPSKRTDPDDPRSATFQLIDGVALYGGFAGTEASVDERNIDANPTVLSGDLNGDDEPGFAHYEDNAWHVVTTRNIGPETLIDGLTIAGGNANAPYPHDAGGGMYNPGGSPKIINCVFRDNSAGAWSDQATTPAQDGTVARGGLYGGGVLNEYPGVPTFDRCRFLFNRATGGGGVAIAGTTTITLLRCEFEGNVAYSGGALAAGEGIVTLTNCTFSRNSAVQSGGGVSMSSSGKFSDCRFTQNTASFGGALYVDRAWGFQLTGCEFTENEAEYSGGGAYLGAFFDLRVADCAFTSNVARIGGGLNLGESLNALVTRSSFTENRAAQDGGGMYIDYGLATVEDCHFESNAARGGGGGLLCAAELDIRRCAFRRNLAGEGGGLYSIGDPLAVIDSLFEENVAVIGAGVLSRSYTSSVFERCRFLYNRAGAGGGVSADYPASNIAIRNSLFAYNSASAYGGGIATDLASLAVENCTVTSNSTYGIGAGIFVGQDATISNTINWANLVYAHDGNRLDETAQIEGIEFATINYSDVQGWSGVYGGEGNIGLDPLFVGPTDPDGPSGPDFHLRPESPCIDAGDPNATGLSAADLDGHARVLCERVEMGAYEFGIGDFDCDRDIDLSDFSQWSACKGGPFVIAPFPDCSAFDFDGDGDIDLVDFAQFVRVFSPGLP